MIRTESLQPDFLTSFTNGKASAEADAPASKGGTGQGFMPSELLEAALASCMNITMRFYAQAHGIEFSGADIGVTLGPDGEGHVFEYEVSFKDELPEDQKKRLIASLKGCPIHGVLSKPIRFALKTNQDR